LKNSFKNTLAVLSQEERKRFWLLTLLSLVISVLDIAFLAGLLGIIQFFLYPGSNIAFLPSLLSEQSPLLTTSIFFILFTVKNIIAYIITKSQYKFIGTVAVRISAQNLISYQQGGFHDFIHVDSSTHIRNICFQPFEFAQYMLGGMQQIMTQVFLVLLSVIAILLYNAEVFLLLLLILLPPVAFTFYFIRKKSGRIKKEIQATNEHSFRYLLDALKGYVEGNIFNKNKFFLDRFVNHRREFSNHLFNSHSLQALPARVIEIFAILGLLGLIAIAYNSSTTSQSTLITIGAFVAAAYKIIPGMVRIINLSGQMKAYEFSPGELVKPKELINDQTPIQSLPVESIKFTNLHFNFGNASIVKNIDLLLVPGDMVGITGASGKGKTTLFNLMLGFLHPSSGEVRINDEIILNGNGRKYWSSIAYVRQQSFLLHDSLLKNITLQDDGYDGERLRLAINFAGLQTIIREWPEGLNTLITENGKNISGGQQQRIAIARAVYKQAPVLLLDEPFNELDEPSVTTMLGHLKDLAAKGKIVVLIAHEQRVLSACNKIISLHEN